MTGIDGILFPPYVVPYIPNLTTLVVPRFEIGCRAVSEIIRRFSPDRRQVGQQIRVELALKVGKSTGVARNGNPLFYRGSKK